VVATERRIEVRMRIFFIQGNVTQSSRMGYSSRETFIIARRNHPEIGTVKFRFHEGPEMESKRKIVLIINGETLVIWIRIGIPCANGSHPCSAANTTGWSI
jgi:hypothetical protein